MRYYQMNDRQDLTDVIIANFNLKRSNAMELALILFMYNRTDYTKYTESEMKESITFFLNMLKSIVNDLDYIDKE